MTNQTFRLFNTLKNEYFMPDTAYGKRFETLADAIYAKENNNLRQKYVAIHIFVNGVKIGTYL